ncbi:MAG: DUF3307 domain-containing protein [Caldilineaceae bacterium]
MNLTAALVVGHLIADFPLQTSWVYRFKTESWLGVVLHSAIHVIVTALLIHPLRSALPMLIVLGILHFITDFTKLRVPAKRQTPGFVIDQMAHLVVVMMLAQYWEGHITASLPNALLFFLIGYGTFLGGMIFLWVLACDLAKSGLGSKPMVRWARTNLLTLSQYAGLSLVFFLAQLPLRYPKRPS